MGLSCAGLGIGLPGTQLKGGPNGKACPEPGAEPERLDPGGRGTATS